MFEQDDRDRLGPLGDAVALDPIALRDGATDGLTFGRVVTPPGSASPSSFGADAKNPGGPDASLGGPSEPILATRHDLSVTGASDNRVDVWFIGDGYTADQLDLLLADAAAQWDWMVSDGFAEPFGHYTDVFNVRVLFAASPEEGADRPNEGIYVETAFGASYAWGGADDRTLYFDEFAADDALARVLDGDDADMMFGVINAEGYGGSGGRYAVYAAGAQQTRSLALHELGHAAAGLGDEYWEAGSGPYQGAAPVAANLSVDADVVPWSHWLGFDDGVLGPIGAYEGGAYAATGIYRPTNDSLMRTLDRPFDAVAREQFVLRFHDAFDPLDAWSFEGQTSLTDAYGTLWAKSVASLVAQEWSIDGEIVSGEDTLDIASLGLAPGTYRIDLRAFDDSPFVRAGREALEQTESVDLTLTFRAGLGTEADDDFRGTLDADRFEGGLGADMLAGGAGADLLFGGDGDDVLYGDDAGFSIG